MSTKIVTVIGLGFVGLPTACVLANTKKKKKSIFSVHGIDKDINTIKNKIFNANKYSEDIKLNKLIKLLPQNKSFSLTKNYKSIIKSDTIIISVGFDFNKKNKITQLKNLKNLFSTIGGLMKKKSLLIIETTLPPGTCDKIIVPILKKELNKRKMKIEDIYLSFSFERIMPGRGYLDSIINNFRCYSGINSASKKKCKNFLQKFINYKKYEMIELESLIDCESAKILENSYRAVNIAFIDEWTKYSNHTGVNLNSILSAIRKRKTHSNIMNPGIGVGGYCLTKDPDFMNYSSNLFSKNKLNFPIIDLANSINLKMPTTSIDFIKSKVKNLNKKKILILGLAYKEDVSDVRFSPSLKIIEYLKRNKIKYKIHDPYAYDKKQKEFIKILPKLDNFSLVIMCVRHSYYKKLNRKILSPKPIYFDLNRVLQNTQINFMKKNNYKLEVLGGN